jgi:7-cyano-7-deazaguanine reductase
MLKANVMFENVKIDLFDNPRPGRDYVITTRVPEFTSVCPKTGQPDFGTITIEYCPDKLCIELKSLKFYMQSFRNKGIFYEALTNEILDYLVGCCKPKWMSVKSQFTPRGGISTDVVCTYKAASDDWN